MSLLPPAVAWLEENAKSWTLSEQKVHSEVILEELQRLNGVIEAHIAERTEIERVRKDERRELLALDNEHRKLKEELARDRDAMAAERTELETSLRDRNDRIFQAENMLKDTHYALTKQPELKREEIAAAITSVVTPYPEGERP